MRKLIVVVMAAMASVLTLGVVLASHSWNGYHWPGDNLSPTVADRTSSNL